MPGNGFTLERHSHTSAKLPRTRNRNFCGARPACFSTGPAPRSQGCEVARVLTALDTTTKNKFPLEFEGSSFGKIVTSQQAPRGLTELSFLPSAEEKGRFAACAKVGATSRMSIMPSARPRKCRYPQRKTTRADPEAPAVRRASRLVLSLLENGRQRDQHDQNSSEGKTLAESRGCSHGVEKDTSMTYWNLVHAPRNTLPSRARNDVMSTPNEQRAGGRAAS